MIHFRTWLSFCLMLLASVATSAESRVDRISYQGREYVRLSDWSRSYGFTNQWVVPQKELKISTKWSKLLFTVDSKIAQINGVNVWLFAPVVGINGAACITSIDIEKSVNPVLFPPKADKEDRIKTICIDPGHGGKDPGNHEGSSLEKVYVLKLAQELKSQLLKAGFKVMLTRSTDSFVPLDERPEIARRNGADLFVSLHFNGVPNARIAAKGAETYCLTPARTSSTNAGGEGAHTGAFPGNDQDELNFYLAFLVQRSLVRSLDVEDRGVRRARFAVLKYATMPAVLIEGGFLSDPTEGRKLIEPGYRRQMAKAIADAIQNYKKTVER